MRDGAVPQKTLLSFTDVPKMQTLIPLKSRKTEVNETPLSTSQTRGEPDVYSGILTDGRNITTPRHPLAPGVVLMPGRQDRWPAGRATRRHTYLAMVRIWPRISPPGEGVVWTLA